MTSTRAGRRRPILSASSATLLLLVAVVVGACSADAGAAPAASVPAASASAAALGAPGASPTAIPTPVPTRAPSARPTPLPTRAPPSPIVALVPFGSVSKKTLQGLASGFEKAYGIEVTVLQAADVPEAARDPERDQLIPEEVIKALRYDFPDVTANRAAVLIGVVDEDLYLRRRPEWAWAFGLRSLGRFAVVSTARMDAPNGTASAKTQGTRLRKMVTKYIGLMYFDLDESDDPGSVMYGDIGGIGDLDAMGEDLPLP